MRVDSHETLAIFRGRPCEWNPSHGPGEPAHIYARGLGDGNRLDLPENLVTLCRTCHTRSHAGQEPTREQLLALAAQREKKDMEEMRAELFRIARLPKDSCLYCERLLWLCECEAGHPLPPIEKELDSTQNEMPF